MDLELCERQIGREKARCAFWQQLVRSLFHHAQGSMISDGRFCDYVHIGQWCRMRSLTCEIKLFQPPASIRQPLTMMWLFHCRCLLISVRPTSCPHLSSVLIWSEEHLHWKHISTARNLFRVPLTVNDPNRKVKPRYPLQWTPKYCSNLKVSAAHFDNLIQVKIFQNTPNMVV